jgi:membrane fusion protein, adhesin transport system
LSSRFTRTTRSLAADTSRYAMFAWLAGGILLLAWLAWFFLARVTVYETSSRARLEVQQSAHPVAALVPSRIVANQLVLGQEVRAGEVLVELDAGSERMRLREEEARLQTIAPRIASLRKELASLGQAGGQDQQSALAAVASARARSAEAGAAVEFAADNERRLKEESGIGGVAQIEALRAHAETRKLSAARDASGSEIRRLETDAQTRGFQHQAQMENLSRAIVSLQGDASTTQATIARLTREIEKHLLRAPVSGTIGDVVQLREGAYVAEGQKLATVIPRGGLIIVADFAPASVLGRIHPGQSARMRLDGFPWAQFGSIDARVTRVGTEITNSLVRVEFAPAAASAPAIAMQHGLPGSIEVSVEETSPAVLVLRSAGQLTSGRMQQASVQPASVPQ